VAVRVAGGFVRNHLILTFAVNEKIVFAEPAAGRKAQPAQSPANGFRTVAARAAEIVKIIVMHPKPLRDLAAGTGNIEHFTQCRFVAEFVMIDLHVVPGDADVRGRVGGRYVEEDGIPGEAAMTRATGNIDASGMRELESLDCNVGRGAAQREALGA